MNILILYDEIPENPTSDQMDVVYQKRAVYRSLQELGHNPCTFCFPSRLKDIDRLIELISNKPDIVFNLIESSLYNRIPDLISKLGIPYTGSSSDALYTTNHKRIMKSYLEVKSIPTPIIYNEDANNAHCKYIIKSTNEHASIGLDENSVVTNNKAIQYGPHWFAEQYIDGREFNVSMLTTITGLKVLPIQETLFLGRLPDQPKIVSYKAKWDISSFDYNHTKRTFQIQNQDRFLGDKLWVLSHECWKLFNLEGYARIDFRVDKDNNPYVIDINANPCLSPDSGFVASAKEAGIEYNQMIQYIIDAAIRH